MLEISTGIRNVCWKIASGRKGRKKWHEESMSEMWSGFGYGVSEGVKCGSKISGKQDSRASQGYAKVS